MNPLPQSATQFGSLISVIALIFLGGIWERYLAPLHPGGSMLSLKVLPLLPILWGMLRTQKRAFQWSVLLVWLYVIEGLVRLSSDHGLSKYLSAIELLLCGLLFASSTLWLRNQRKV